MKDFCDIKWILCYKMNVIYDILSNETLYIVLVIIILSELHQ